jgi:hypothetical protein
MANIDNIIETPIIATEVVTDPAAPALGLGAGAKEGLRSFNLSDKIDFFIQIKEMDIANLHHHIFIQIYKYITIL